MFSDDRITRRLIAQDSRLQDPNVACDTSLVVCTADLGYVRCSIVGRIFARPRAGQGTSFSLILRWDVVSSRRQRHQHPKDGFGDAAGAANRFHVSIEISR